MRILSADEPYQPPPRPKTRWFGYSTLVFLALCGFGYYKYQDYVAHPPPPPPRSRVELRDVPTSANPFSAFKQAKAIIKDAGDKHKAAYSTVDAMLDGTGTSSQMTPWTPSRLNLVETGPRTGAAPLFTQVPPTDTTAAPSASLTAPKGTPPAVTPSAQQASRQAALPDTPLESMAGQELFSPAGSPPVKQAFLYWAQTVKISGVRTGQPLRVLIDSTTYKTGEVVQTKLGIVFDGYDEATHVLRFRDARGAVICYRHD
jgi:hypothetical protein